MSIELQTSDLRSRVIERTTPTQIPISDCVHFEIPEPDTLVRVSDHQGRTVYQGSDIKPDGLFRMHNVPDGSRWILNRKPRSLWEIFVKQQIVFVAPESQV